MKSSIVLLLITACAFAANHYNYVGRDPAAWTRTATPQSKFLLPTAGYTTFIGDANVYRVAQIAVDAAGNTYVAGSRVITASSSDAFVSKIDASGNLIFTATLSGKESDQANAVAVDPQGNIYIAGNTSSTDLPLRNALQTQPGGSFIAKFTSDGILLYSTYFGGAKGPSSLSGIAVDSNGNMYVTGTTGASDFSSTPGLPSDKPSFGIAAHLPALIGEISAAGDRILWSALLNGTQHSCYGGSSCFLSPYSSTGEAIALDPAGNVYVAGNTVVRDLPATPGAFAGAGGVGPFIAKVKADGSALSYLTYISDTVDLAGIPASRTSALAVDAAGNAYIVGDTEDSTFPTTPGALQTSYAGPQPGQTLFNYDAFILKLNPTGTALVWSTYLSGSQPDNALSIAVDKLGNSWVSGTVSSLLPGFPDANGWTAPGNDFLVELNPSASALSYSARFPTGTASQSVAVDAAGTVHLAGTIGILSTFTPGIAPVPRVFGIANAAYGPLSGRIVPGELISIYGPHIGPATPASSFGPAPKSLGGVQVTIGGLPAPLLYVSDSQIDAIVPFELPTVAPAEVSVTNNGAALLAFPVYAITADPEVFRNADGSTAALNQDGSVNSASNPAKAGSVVSIWATGLPAPYALGPDGAIASSALNTCNCDIVPPTYNPPQVLVTYAGNAPGMFFGIAQINFVVPAPGPARRLLSPYRPKAQ